MDQRKLTEGQRAYEARRAAKAGMSLEKWLAQRERERREEQVQVAKAEAAPAKKGFFARMMEKAQKPL